MTLPILHELLNLVPMVTLGLASSVYLIPPVGVCRCMFDTEMHFTTDLPTLQALLNLVLMVTLGSTSSMVLMPPEALTHDVI